jgi:hypothetical protein
MTYFRGEPPRNASWLSRIFNPLAQIAVAVYLVLDSIFRTLFRPVSRWLAKLRLVIRLEELISGLPPYAVLGLLILPFAIAEPAKVFAIYLMGSGHVITGTVLLIAAYLVSVLVVDRIFQAGKPKLLTIPWFAKLWSWISNYKEQFLTWMKSTAAWKRMGEIKKEIRDLISKLRKRFA